VQDYRRGGWQGKRNNRTSSVGDDVHPKNASKKKNLEGEFVECSGWLFVNEETREAFGDDGRHIKSGTNIFAPPQKRCVTCWGGVGFFCGLGKGGRLHGTDALVHGEKKHTNSAKVR